MLQYWEVTSSCYSAAWDAWNLEQRTEKGLWKRDDLVFLGANRPTVWVRKFPGQFAPGNESSRERKGQGAKRPGSERARERKFQGAKVPGSELARVLLADSLQGANWPGSEKAVNRLNTTNYRKSPQISMSDRGKSPQIVVELDANHHKSKLLKTNSDIYGSRSLLLMTALAKSVWMMRIKFQARNRAVG